MHLNDKFSSEHGLKQKLKFIYDQSKMGRNFHSILEIAFNEITITTAIHNIKSNQGSKTAGIDGINIDKYLHMDKDKLIKLIQKQVKRYKPKPVRRVHIRKSNGKKRPLGIPTMLDRIIQECLRIVLEPIVEAKLFPHSYGFRPFRASKHAIAKIINTINIRSDTKPIYVIEGDIKGYFDNINHRILINKLWGIGIRDKRVIAIIKEMLKAGYIELGLLEKTDIGTPQGGIISPLLANVYLNDFDWTVGRMYETARYEGHNIDVAGRRKHLKNKGVVPKYLIRYADDWMILCTTEQEAKRLLRYLRKYFKAKLKLELSDEKTVITNITKEPAKFLGFLIKAEERRATPENPKKKIVGKNYPNPKKVREQVQKITKEIRLLRSFTKIEQRAAQVEKINAIIIGVAEYWKTSICNSTFGYIDDKVNRTAVRTFKRMYGKDYWQYEIPLEKVNNRPQRHEQYKWKTFAIKFEDLWIGLTKAGITHSKWEKYPFNQKITPYTDEGISLYLKQFEKKKLPLDRPPLYDVDTLIGATTEKNKYNFEYLMNREYAYNRDKGKCKICENELLYGQRHCHHINNKLPMNEINKVKNLAWLCVRCHLVVHGKDIPVVLGQ